MPGNVPASEIRQQLERMLRSEQIIRADSPTRLLKYLVTRHLRGKKSSDWDIATAVFRCDEDWIGESNSIVRTNLVRLRKAIASYYTGDGKFDPVSLRIVGRQVIATYRPIAPAIVGPSSEAPLTPFTMARNAFFADPEGTVHCVVTGESNSLKWHPLDGDPVNDSLANHIPLCLRFYSHLEGLRQKTKRTNLPQLAPKRLSTLAANHFRAWEIAAAYGCAALAFHMGEPPYGEEPSDVRVFRLCDVIHYARHHFLEPLMHQVIQQVALPFLSRIERIDPVAALRLSLQLTALLEEAGYYPDAEASLALAEQVRRHAAPSFFERGSQNAFTLTRRRAQLLAEGTPGNAKFHELLQAAQEHTANAPDRILTLNVVRIHRWLRLGSPAALKSAHDALTPLIAGYSRSLFQGERLIIPRGLGPADFSEIFLLSGITACRLRPEGWKAYAEETAASAQKLMHLGGHILPAEYAKFIADATVRNNAKATRALRMSVQQVRPLLRTTARANIAAIVKCLARVRVLESSKEGLLRVTGPDL